MIREYFRQFGAVKECNQLSNCAFLTMDSVKDVSEAVKKRWHTINGVGVDVKRAKAHVTGDDDGDPLVYHNCRIYVGDLNGDITAEDITFYFESIGMGVVDAVVVQKDNSSRG